MKSVHLKSTSRCPHTTTFYTSCILVFFLVTSSSFALAKSDEEQLVVEDGELYMVSPGVRCRKKLGESSDGEGTQVRSVYDQI